MEWHHILQAILSLIFVIGLLFLTLWVFKYLEQKGLRSKFIKTLKSGQRLEVLEKRALDSRTQVALIRADNAEYLILLGSGGNLLLDSHSVSGQNNHG